MLLSSLSEMLSLSAIMPFLGALGNAEKLLRDPQLESLLAFFQITTPFQLVTGLAIVFTVAVIIANGLRLWTINAQTHLAANISSHISCQLYNKVLLQPYSFHIKHNSSDLINLVTVDSRSLTTQILIPLLDLTTNVCVTVALIGGLVLISWRVALIAGTILGGVYIGLYRLRAKQVSYYSNIRVQKSKQQIKVVQEGVGSIRDVLIGGSHTFFQSAYRDADWPFRHAIASISIAGQTPRYIIEAIAMISIALLALILGKGGDFSRVVPVLGGLALGANRLLPALQRIFSALVRIQGASVSLKQIVQGLQRQADPLQAWLPDENLPLRKELRLEDVWFRYSDSADWVLRGLNLSIAAKTTVGFIGTTGSGKSTTADLILGLLKSQRGKIWADNQLLEGENLRKWQKTIAHVPQSIFLADATLLENIAFGIPKEQINFEEVRKAARLAQIDEFIQDLPAEYETYVGERGVRLSGGQRQRIGIARALYKQVSIIVFDEATSALDNQTEREVMDAIYNLSQKVTVILIAHRLSTVQKCDKIIELKQGTKICEGPYEEISKKSDVFQAMNAYEA